MDPELLTGLGAALAIFLASTGSAIASAHSGTFALRSTSMKGFLPIVISGVLAIYGIIIGVLLCLKFGDTTTTMTPADGYRNISAGLSVGLGCLASGIGMSIFIKQCNEAMTVPFDGSCLSGASIVAAGEQEPLLNGHSANGSSNKPPFRVCFLKLFFVMVFLEAIGLYGLVVALFLIGSK